MATTTTNLGLIEPAGQDRALVANINTNSDKIDAEAGKSRANFALVQNGDTATQAISQGQLVVWKGALKKATANIASGATLSSSNLTDDSIASEIASLNTNIAIQYSYAHSATGIVKTGDYISNNAFVGKAGGMKLLYLYIQLAQDTPATGQYVEIATVSNDYKPTVEQATMLSNDVGQWFELRFFTDGKIKIYNYSTSGKINGAWIVPYI